MTAQFFDRQEAGPVEGVTVHSSAELRNLLSRIRDRKPFFAELVGDNGFKLLLGIGAPESCVQFSSTDGSPPYLMAVDPGRGSNPVGEVEYLIGDTATPVPKRFVLPYPTMVEVAARFVDEGDRHTGVLWEEV